MSNSILEVRDLGKSYRRYGSEWRRIFGWIGLSSGGYQDNWVLRGVNFTLGRGEAVGILGQNGAGKSTLLKLITGVTHPTEGSVHVEGRISALLELGIGFNGEFTGRENARHSAGLTGFSDDEIDRLMPQIEAFADIGSYFDQPLRTYSSGMQVRLAFATATAVRPELLIVDEALSVGDSYFQHKSFDRIRKFKEQGTSILFVTHSTGDVRALCDRVILLANGAVLRQGQPDEVVDYYNALIAEKESQNPPIEQHRSSNGWLVSRSGNKGAIIGDVTLIDAVSEKSVEAVQVGQALILRVVVSASIEIPVLHLGVMLRDRTGHVVYGSNTFCTRQAQTNVQSGEVLCYHIAFSCNLGPASYSVTLALASSEAHINNYDWIDNILVFDVINPKQEQFIGTSYLQSTITIVRDESYV